MPTTVDPTAGDPFNLLLNAGSSPDLWLFVGGPVALLALIIAVYFVLVVIRNRREREMMRAALAETDAKAGEAGEAGEADEADAAGEPVAAFGEAGATRPTDGPESAPESGQAATKDSDHFEAAPLGSATRAGSEVDEIRQLALTSPTTWLGRLRDGLARTRESLRSSLESLFTGKVTLNADLLERLHEVLYRADIGAQTADKLVDHVRSVLGKDAIADWEAVRAALREKARSLLAPAVGQPLNRPEQRGGAPDGQHGDPWVILVVGVNGVGKTTTIGKLSAHFLADDKRVLLGAADTFRAAAIEQLSVWGDRLGVDVIKHKQGSDPAAVAYDAVKAAVARQVDVLLIDTAGRLHAKTELMAELGKINRVIGKDCPGAPHETWLVIDATTGQNAVQQVKAFAEVVKLTGLVVTKLDGTAKGGVILGIVDQFKLPVRYVGVGEKAVDLRPFVAADYADSLF